MHKNLKLSEEECKVLAATMDRKYASFLKERFFELSVRADKTGVYATVLLRNKKKSYYYPIEGRIADLDHELNQQEACLFLIDYIDTYLENFFQESGEVFLPIDWTTYDWEGVPVQLKGQIFNLEIEELADQWLASGGAPSSSQSESLH